MNLMEVISEYQSKISDTGILIEYELFFQKANKKYCRFVIDDEDELRKLDRIILKIREIDIDSEIYVNTYRIGTQDEIVCIYADTLWINTVIGLNELADFFENIREVEPSDIVLLAEDEAIDGTVALVVSADNKIEDYNSFIKKKSLNKIKSLYWD